MFSADCTLSAQGKKAVFCAFYEKSIAVSYKLDKRETKDFEGLVTMLAT